MKSFANDSLKVELYSLYNFNIFEYETSPGLGLEGLLINAYKGWYNYLLNPGNQDIANQTLGYIHQYMEATDSVVLTDQISLNRIFLQQYKVRIHAYRKEQVKALNANLCLGKMIGNIQCDEVSTELFTYYNFISSAYDYIDSYLQEENFLYAIISSNEVVKRIDMLMSVENCFRTDDSFVQTESAYFLMKAYGEIEEDYRLALTYSGWLVKNYPKNIIFQVEHFKYLTTSGIEFDKLQQEYDLLIELIAKSKMTPVQMQHIKDVLVSYFECI